MNNYSIEPARLTFQEGAPFSSAFGDFYHSRHGGLEETRHVFLNGNDLPLTFEKNRFFIIGETGFGTGLNFLAALKLWREKRQDGFLEFISTEKHPLTRTDLAQALAPYKDELPGIQTLIKAYPPLVAGFHRIHFARERACLTLLLGDATERFSEMNARVNAWFLDGFSPAKNQDLWHPDLFREIARLSAPGATLATYTVARKVKEGLTAAGFSLQKRPGFAYKNEMLTGVKTGTDSFTAPETVTVIGAGIAGTATAWALARRGIKVVLKDSHPRPGMETSSNPAAVVYPRLTARPSPEGRFFGEGFLHTTRIFKQFFPELYHATGVHQLAYDDDRRQRQQGFLQHLGLTEEVIRPTEQGIFFPEGGWINLTELCQVLSQNPAIQLRQETVKEKGKEPTIFCTNHHLPRHVAVDLEPVAGQIIMLPHTSAENVTTYDGYAIATGEQLILGSSYHRGQEIIEDEETATASILQKAGKHFALPAAPQIEIWQGVRAATPQRFPCFGEASPGLYYHSGLGSHGASTALFTGELLASLICGQSYPQKYLEMGAKAMRQQKA